jgi:hypothetical protein
MRDSVAAPPQARYGGRALVVALVLLAAAAHGAQVADLGLYWDDILQYLQGHHSARGDLLRFVVSDTSGALVTERPLSYLAWAAARIAYAWSVPALHVFLVLLLALEAFLVARLASRLSAEPWVAVAAGALFLTLPLAPLQPAWGATVHHQVALALTLLAMLSSERAVARGSRSLAAFVPAALLYLAALLTEELYFLLPFAWLAGLWIWPEPGGDASAPSRGAARRSALLGVAALFGAASLFALFRLFLQPIYGTENYALPTEIEPSVVLRRSFEALRFSLWPWPEVQRQLSDPEPSARPLAGAALSALAFCAALLATARRGREPEPAGAEAPRARRAVVLAALLVLAAAATRGAVPIEANKIAEGISSRFNFVELPGAALGLAALFGWALSALRARPRIVRPLIAVPVVAAVAAGAFCHGLVKERLVSDWRRLLATLDGIRAQAPAFADGTMIVVTGDAFSRIATHEEMSSLFMALYDNQTLMANDLKRLRGEPSGAVVSLTYGHRAHWFSPREHPVVNVHATELLPDLDQERLVLFRSRGGRVVAVPALTVDRGREGIVLHHHPELVLDTPAHASRAWLHLDSTR